MFIKSHKGIVHNWYKPHLLHTHTHTQRWATVDQTKVLLLTSLTPYRWARLAIFIYCIIVYTFPSSSCFSSSGPSLSFVGDLGRITWVRHSSHKSSATLSYQRVQYFCVSKHGCHCLGFWTCEQILMHVIAHGGCADAVRESAQKVNYGRNVPCHTRDLSLCQYCAWLFSLNSTNWAIMPHCWKHGSFCCC